VAFTSRGRGRRKEEEGGGGAREERGGSAEGFQRGDVFWFLFLSVSISQTGVSS